MTLKTKSDRVGCSLSLLRFMMVAVIACMGFAHGAERSTKEIQEARTRFESAGAGYRQTLMKVADVSEVERDALGDVKFVYELSSLPDVQSIRQFGQRRVAVSDGWMSLMEEVILADRAAFRWGAEECFVSFVQHALSVVRTNRERRSEREPNFAYVPRFEAYAKDVDRKECSSLRQANLRAKEVGNEVRGGVDAALAWIIGRELALQLNPRDMTPAVPPGARADTGDSETSSQTAKNRMNMGEARCRIKQAERISVLRAGQMRLNLLPGYVAVVVHEAIFGDEGDPKNCAGERSRLDVFFDLLRVSDGSLDHAGQTMDIEDARLDAKSLQERLGISK